MSHSCPPPIHTHFPCQSIYNRNRSEYTHVHGNEKNPWQHTLPSAVSEVSLVVEPSYRAQPSLASPPWLAAGIYCREEREWPSCEANCSLQREREREGERQKKREERGGGKKKVCWGTSRPKRLTVCNDWLQACREGSSEKGRGGRRLTCSGVSSIAAQTRP